jgi:uncharacterized protein
MAVGSTRPWWHPPANPAGGHTGHVTDIQRPADRPPQPSTARSPRVPNLHGFEVLAVLGVSLGMSGLYALLYYLRAEVTVTGGISSTTATVVSGPDTSYVWLDLLDDLVALLQGVVPAFLVLVLLARDPGVRRGFGIGLDWLRPRRELLQGVGFAAVIGLPGLGLVWLAHEVGVNASLAVVNLPDVWYRIPLLVLEAAQNGLLEELVVVGYLLTRLGQLGWRNPQALAASAVLRGSYHLYQGLGGFAGNLLMGLIFGWWFQRTRRVVPLVVAHFVLDTVSFVGYVYLHTRISWI